MLSICKQYRFLHPSHYYCTYKWQHGKVFQGNKQDNLSEQSLVCIYTCTVCIYMERFNRKLFMAPSISSTTLISISKQSGTRYIRGTLTAQYTWINMDKRQKALQVFTSHIQLTTKCYKTPFMLQYQQKLKPSDINFYPYFTPWILQHLDGVKKGYLNLTWAKPVSLHNTHLLYRGFSILIIQHMHMIHMHLVLHIHMHTNTYAQTTFKQLCFPKGTIRWVKMYCTSIC